MKGAWVYVCGPSGAGKDSVIAQARARLTARSDIVFARRLITRKAHASSEHDPIDEATFRQLLRAGGLAMHWGAHGANYGISARYAADVRAGKTVVVNGSRAHLHELRADLPASGVRLHAVQIVADVAALAARLQQRARDGAQAIQARLARNAMFAHFPTDAVIVNDGKLTDAGARLAEFVQWCAAAKRPL